MWRRCQWGGCLTPWRRLHARCVDVRAVVGPRSVPPNSADPLHTLGDTGEPFLHSSGTLRLGRVNSGCGRLGGAETVFHSSLPFLCPFRDTSVYALSEDGSFPVTRERTRSCVNVVHWPLVSHQPLY